MKKRSHVGNVNGNVRIQKNKHGLKPLVYFGGEGEKFIVLVVTTYQGKKKTRPLFWGQTKGEELLARAWGDTWKSRWEKNEHGGA